VKFDVSGPSGLIHETYLSTLVDIHGAGNGAGNY
jgi:hypothetical protein